MPKVLKGGFIVRFKDRVAIVTASAGAGIGRACVEAFAKEGANVVVADIHEKRINETASYIASTYGVGALGVTCDVSSAGQVNEMVVKTKERFGRIDILVNNAGRETLAQCKDMTDEQWRLVLSVCLDGAFYCTRAVLPHMIEQNYGRLVHISSINAFVGATDGEAHYCAAKAGILALSRVVAAENARYNITSNVIAPGLIMNEFLKKIYPPEFFERLVNMCPKGRAGRPEEVANAVLFFAHESSEFITGEVLTVSGGLYMHA
jgi:3-oxoacyl-[acyl-carrier protein] reductase